ncbi:MAG: alpha/beta fold hydrolase [Sporichthyaceae bacterium]
MGAETIEVEGRGVRVRVEGAKDAPPVVLVHGISRSLDDWNLQFPLLSRDFRVIALDLPGFGYSARRDEPATLGALSRGLLATLDALDERRPVNLVGNSLGGAVSLQTLVLDPDRVASVVLVNSAGFGKEVTYLLRGLAIPGFGRAMLRKPTRAGLRHAERALYHDRSLADRERVAHSLNIGRQADAAEFMAELMHTLGTFRGVLPQWREELLRDAGVHRHPMLIVWGDRDRILPPHHFEAARTAFPHAKSHLFRTTGHLPQVERPDAFANLVREFLAPPVDGEVEKKRA